MRARVAILGLLAVAAAPAVRAEPAHLVRARAVDVGALPSDMAFPEGKSRWHLETVAPGPSYEEGIWRDGDRLVVGRTLASGTAYAGAEAWLFPDRGRTLKVGTKTEISFRRGGTTDVRAESEIVGIGWVHLPAGPREVVLERALLYERPDGAGGWTPVEIDYRWVDPRAGVVAETSGTPSADGKSMLEPKAGFVVDEVVLGAADLKIYVDQLYKDDDIDLNYGWDRGAVSISSLTPDGFATAGDLVNNTSYWDFSANTTGLEVAQTAKPVNQNQTCNYNQCGYTRAGGQLGRQDKDFDNATSSSIRRDNQVTTREDRVGDVTIWVWAGAQKEGKPGAFGDGESRYCYSTEGGTTRNPVPLWRFGHQDAGGWFFQPGDSWYGGPESACQQTLFSQVCGSSSGQIFPILYASGNPSTCTGHTGRQSGEVLKNGVVKTVSGHTFNASVVRTVADFCVYWGSGCSSLTRVDQVRTVVYLWQVPWLGSVALLQSVQNAPDLTSWTATENTILSFGLYPPISISTTGTTDTSVSLSWNPGNDVHRISRYKIYWDTDSGSSTGYAFDSDANPGQVSFAGTTATVSGLTPGTTYYFTVTSLSTFQPPQTLASSPPPRPPAVEHESILYPTQVSGDPAFVYPVEVQAATTGGSCTPTAEVTGVVVNKDVSGVQVCWNPVSDSCLEGYDVLGSASASSDAGYTTVGSTGLTTCWTGNPAGSYFLVVARGSGGQGPWGHYGR